MTVTELLGRISSRDLSEWMAFSQLEPFGTEAGYVGNAITSMTVANVNREKGQKAYELMDFMPTRKKKKEQSVSEMIQIAQVMTIGMGGKDLRDKE